MKMKFCTLANIEMRNSPMGVIKDIETFFINYSLMMTCCQNHAR